MINIAMDIHSVGYGTITTTLVEPGLIRTGMAGSALLQRLLSADTDFAAQRILQSATKGMATCQFSLAITCITLVIALLPIKILSCMWNTCTPSTQQAQ